MALSAPGDLDGAFGVGGTALIDLGADEEASSVALQADGRIIVAGAWVGGAHSLRAAVFAGGTLGAVARLALDRLIPVTPGHWPWPTFAANIIGTLLLGYFTTRLLERLPPSTHLRPLLGTGFCGALTTFSTFQIEAIELGRGGHAPLAATYVAVSIGAGMLAIAASTALVRRARRRLGSGFAGPASPASGSS